MTFVYLNEDLKPTLHIILVSINVELQFSSGNVIKIEEKVISSCTNNNQSISKYSFSFIFPCNALEPCYINFEVFNLL